MPASNQEQTPLRPLAENHAQVLETIIFYYGHLLVGYLAAYTGTLLPFHATWLENYTYFLTFAFVLSNMSILISRVATKTTDKKGKSFKRHLFSLMFGFFFTLLVGIILGLVEGLFKGI